jgi:hypothetical protein
MLIELSNGLVPLTLLPLGLRKGKRLQGSMHAFDARTRSSIVKNSTTTEPKAT